MTLARTTLLASMVSLDFPVVNRLRDVRASPAATDWIRQHVETAEGVSMV